MASIKHSDENVLLAAGEAGLAAAAKFGFQDVMRSLNAACDDPEDFPTANKSTLLVNAKINYTIRIKRVADT